MKELAHHVHFTVTVVSYLALVAIGMGAGLLITRIRDWKPKDKYEIHLP